MVDVPMAMSITTVGIEYLKTEAKEGRKAQFSGFLLGDSYGLDINEDTVAVADNVVYMGTPEQIQWSRVNDFEITLRLTLDHTVGDFDVGSFLLNAGGVPFFVGKLNYLHHKMKTHPTGVGGNFVIQIRFLMYDVHLHWDLTNLTERHAGMVPLADETEAEIHPVEFHHQMAQLEDLTTSTGRSGYVLYPGRFGLNWRASGFQMRDDDPKFWRIDGGKDGDGHSYVFPET